MILRVDSSRRVPNFANVPIPRTASRRPSPRSRITEAAVIAFLLFFNAALRFFQEGKRKQRSRPSSPRLALNASVQRDGAWKVVPSAELGPGDLVKLSLGAVVPADGVPAPIQIARETKTDYNREALRYRQLLSGLRVRPQLRVLTAQRLGVPLAD